MLPQNGWNQLKRKVFYVFEILSWNSWLAAYRYFFSTFFPPVTRRAEICCCYPEKLCLDKVLYKALLKIVKGNASGKIRHGLQDFGKFSTVSLWCDVPPKMAQNTTDGWIKKNKPNKWNLKARMFIVRRVRDWRDSWLHIERSKAFLMFNHLAWSKDFSRRIPSLESLYWQVFVFETSLCISLISTWWISRTFPAHVSVQGCPSAGDPLPGLVCSAALLWVHLKLKCYLDHP